MSSPAPSPRTAPRVGRAHARYALALLVAVYAVNFIDRNILAILLQPIKQEFQVSDTWMGLLTGFAFAVFYTFAGIPIARLADRGSRRTVMAVGIAFWSLMTAASGMARSFVQLAIARIGVGVGEASATPAAHSLISDLFPLQRRTAALALYNTGASLGILFGLLLGGWLAQSFGWRVAFVAVGLPGLLVALLVRFTIPEPPRGATEGYVDRGDAPGTGETLRYLLAMPTFRHLAAAAALYSIGAYGLLNWAPTFMLRVHKLGYLEIGTKLGLVIGIGGALGQLAGGLLCDRLARRDRRWLLWLPALLGAGLTPFYAAFVLAEDPDLALLAFVPVNLMNAVFAAPTYTLTQGLASLRMRATAAAILLFVLNLIGMGLGPTLVGVLNDAFQASRGDAGIRLSLLVLLLANLWGALHSLLAARTLTRDLDRTAARDRA
jgi:predicted MFS family arabinose efflux permease